MYNDLSTNDIYPKTLVIRIYEEGMIWQIYHVKAKYEADQLASNATRNGFHAISLEDYQPNYEETWPDWRDTPGGQNIINNANSE